MSKLRQDQCHANYLEIVVKCDNDILRSIRTMLIADVAVTVLAGALTVGGLTATFQSAKEGFFPGEARTQELKSRAESLCSYRSEAPAECETREFTRMQDMEKKRHLGDAFSLGCLTAAGLVVAGSAGCMLARRSWKSYSDLKDSRDFHSAQLKQVRDRISELQKNGKPANDMK